jgi:hypothetical protein
MTGQIQTIIMSAKGKGKADDTTSVISDKKPNKIIKIVLEQVVWAASFLIGNAYKSFEFYMTYFLFKGGLVSSCEAPVKKIFNDLNLYFALLGQFYGDLNEIRTIEQNL